MHDTQVIRPENAPSTPSLKPGDSTCDLLPPDLVEEALRRLGLACLIYAATYATAFGTGMLLADMDALDHSYRANLQGNDLIISISSVILSLAFFWLVRSRTLPAGTLLSLGLLYEVLGAFGIEIGRFWNPTLGQVSGISWTCVWVICFSVIVPMRPTKTLMAAFCAASMGPAALAISLYLGMLPPEARLAPAILADLFIPSYICAALAFVCSKIIFNLGRDVRRARQMGSYELVEKLGSGGMGEVWRARHRLLARPAAVKLVRPEVLGAEGTHAAAVLARFEREAHATALLRSPHTIMLYDFGKTDTGLLYYAMEYLEGLDLQALVDHFGAQTPARTVHLLDQALRSLGEAHTQGLLHRDVKPSNLFLTTQAGEPDFLKVLDFGLVKEAHRPTQQDAAVTGDGAIIGTPLYMAPERFYGDTEADHRADLYAIGAVAYFLMSGRPVFDARSPVQILIQQAHTQPASLRSLDVDISPELDAAILRALEKEPARRFSSAAEFRSCLYATPEWGRWTQEEAELWWQKYSQGEALPRDGDLLLED